MYLEFGDVSRAVEVAQSALSKIETAGLSGTDEHIRLGATLVAAASERGDRLYATHRIEALIRIADRHSTTRARGSVYWNAGVIAHRRGRQDDAIRLTDRAVALLGEQEDSRDLPRLRMHYAWLLIHADEPSPDEALHQLELAEADSSLLGSQLDRGERAILRGRAYLLQGHLDDAAENAAISLQLLGPSDHLERAGALLLLGDVGIAQHDEALARDSFCEMELVLRGMSASREVARLWRELGDSLREFGDMPSAVSAYDSSLSMLGMAKSSTSGRVAQPTA
jgi:tetratricopeptide (TPR) repeat protein